MHISLHIVSGNYNYGLPPSKFPVGKLIIRFDYCRKFYAYLEVMAVTFSRDLRIGQNWSRRKDDFLRNPTVCILSNSYNNQI